MIRAAIERCDFMGIPLVKYVKGESGRLKEIGIVEFFKVWTKNQNWKITKNSFVDCIPQNTVTVWILEQNYGIKKATTIYNIRNGKLNAFMIGFDGEICLKWWIECDNKLLDFIKKNGKIEQAEKDSLTINEVAEWFGKNKS